MVRVIVQNSAPLLSLVVPESNGAVVQYDAVAEGRGYLVLLALLLIIAILPGVWIYLIAKRAYKEKKILQYGSFKGLLRGYIIGWVLSLAMIIAGNESYFSLTLTLESLPRMLIFVLLCSAVGVGVGAVWGHVRGKRATKV